MHGFGVRLRDERKRLGQSQTDFGAIGGVKLVAQSNYEQEKRFPDAQYLSRIAEAGVDVQFLLTGERRTSRIDLEFLDYIARCLEKTAAEVGREWTAVELLHSAVEVYHFFLDSGVERTSEQVARVVRLVVSR